MTRLVVCSREIEYKGLTERLQVQGAVVVRPLSRAQVAAHLRESSPELASVLAALGADEELWDLLTTPLMLNVMTVAQSRHTSELLFDENDLAARRRVLFDEYVVAVLARRRPHDAVDIEFTLRAIGTLASSLNVFRFGRRFDVAHEGIGAPSQRVLNLWLLPAAGSVCAVVLAAALAMQVGGAVGVIFAVVAASFLLWRTWKAPRVYSPIADIRALIFVLAAIALAVGACVAGLVYLQSLWDSPWTLASIVYLLTIVASVRRSRRSRRRRPRFSGDWVMVGGVVLAALAFVIAGEPPAIRGWLVGFVAAICATAVLAAQQYGPVQSTGTDPGAVRVLRVQMIAYTVVLLAAPLAVGGTSATNLWIPLAGCVAGMASAFIVSGTIAPGLAVVLARSAMVVAGQPMPWGQKFLEQAADRNLLTYADGKYRFVHLLIQEHLAACDPQRLADEVVRRRSELVTAVPRLRA